MRESGFHLEHALESARLAQHIRAVLSSTAQGRASEEIESLIVRIDKILEQTPPKYVPVEWLVVVAGFRMLTCQVAQLKIAKGASGDLLTERERFNIFNAEFKRLLSSPSLKLAERSDSTRQSLLQTERRDFEELCEFLASIPLPTLYWNTTESKRPYLDTVKEKKPGSNPILRTIVFLDQAPTTTPQLLKSNILYPLVFRIHGLVWPKAAIRLRLNFLTTCPHDEYSISEFTMEAPNFVENDEYEGELAGNIKFNSGQSSLLDDLIFTVLAAFEIPNGTFSEVPIIGHNEIRVRVVNEDRHPLMTGNRRLDRHIEELVVKLEMECPKIHGELTDLLAMLEALTQLLATYAQEAIYKGRSDVSEPEFHATVLRDLRNILGQDVQNHPNQAGGITDIRYRGVIVELKVETENGNREYMSKKYSAQSVQYAGIEARQVSILLVLDLTTKDNPPGDIRNDILLVDVETHGGDKKEFPSKAFVFVVNGNMKSPSTYSR